MERIIQINQTSTLYVGRAEELLERVLPEGRTVVITDANIDRLYPNLVRRFEHIIVGQGEVCKSLQTVERVYRELMAMGADRSTFILGIGGGIVTDIAGYVAATYMRGVEFGFVSTTLLGQVDASIGGKNGVNVADYKNMVGTFRHPRFVIADVEMLRTLPKRELRAGMAEIVKSAIIADAELFGRLERCGEAIYDSVEDMQEAMLGAVAVKAHIVKKDEREGGVRRLLNLGHTLGHAIEKCTHEVNHGEAVAIGMSLVAHAAVRRDDLGEDVAERIDKVLMQLGLKLEMPVTMTEMLREVKYDKKKKNNTIRLIVPKRIGKCAVVEMSFEELEQLFK
ncbi:MAG: 3-dehydroquinate synthase [Alistipes sp.]|nr:3-dehydroquinate synthase [Alistipes sp.]